MQISTQLSFSFPLEMVCSSMRGDGEEGDGQKFLLHQSLKITHFKHAGLCGSCSALARDNLCVGHVRLRLSVCVKTKVSAKCERIDG